MQTAEFVTGLPIAPVLLATTIGLRVESGWKRMSHW